MLCCAAHPEMIPEGDNSDLNTGTAGQAGANDGFGCLAGNIAARAVHLGGVLA